MRRAKKIVLLMGVLLTVCSADAFAGSGYDSLWPKHSLRLEIGGRSGVGGFTFERAWQNPQTKHPRAFSSVDINLGYFGYTYGFASIGLHRNWYMDTKRRWTISGGLVLAGFICVDPTPKSIRDYQDSTGIYNYEYERPIAPWLAGSIACRYSFNRMFVQADFTPIFYIESGPEKLLGFWPWGGVSVGYYFKHKSERSIKPKRSDEQDETEEEEEE